MISVVIPTLNAASRIGPCLASLSPAVMEAALADVVIVDGGSDDEIEEIADATGATFLKAPPGRGGQLRAGAEAARGDWLLFLHADTALSDDWLDAARAHIGEGAGAAGWFRLAFDGGDGERAARFVAGWANLRSRFGLPYGDQGLLIHRSLYRAIDGHPDIPLMEDVAIARRLGRRRLARLDAIARTSAARYRRRGWVRQGSRNLLTLARYLLGASPEALAEAYRR